MSKEQYTIRLALLGDGRYQVDTVLGPQGVVEIPKGKDKVYTGKQDDLHTSVSAFLVRLGISPNLATTHYPIIE
jgi:hypothetical protein